MEPVKKEDRQVIVSESQLKCALNEHKHNLLRFDVIFSVLGLFVSLFLGAFAIEPVDPVRTGFKIAFFVLSGVAGLGFIVLLIINIVHRFSGKGTEKWFVDEIFNSHPPKIKKEKKNNKDIGYTVLSVFVAILPCLALCLTVFGLNGWSTAWITNTSDGLGYGGLILLIIACVAWFIFSPFATYFIATMILGLSDE